jgi:hypothetical protein
MRSRIGITRHSRGRTSLAWCAVALAWVVTVAIGMRILWAYEYTPGISATAPASWPPDTRLPSPDGHHVLVLLMHPQCSCSRATLAELARLMARVQGRVATYVLMLDPFNGTNQTWMQSDLATTAAAIPGVRVLRDGDGREARRFGAWTSGQALLYDAVGRLRFSGGLTDARGHEGDNAGRASLESILLRDASGDAGSPVFGCGLFAQ